MENALNILDSKPFQITGRISFLLALFGGILNMITKMDILHEMVVIASGILGIIFIAFKIYKIRIEIIKENETRIAEGKDPIRFLAIWKRKRKK